MFTLDQSQIQEYQKDKPEYYRQLAKQLEALLAEDSNWVTNLAQTSAFIFQMLPGLNWAGFYLVNPKNLEALILGPYQGKVACVHIPFGRGVCGVAAASLETQLVQDVHAFAGHIACDSETNSEVVVPMIVDTASGNKELKGVLDIDSPEFKRFDQEDADGLTKLLTVLLENTDF
ncbi:GAF domain-containing protein [Kangiella sp. TOML190]|uniref:GAF domain-containing protein n=1 Tax=Kangiella sp. TOML190 TaxID=2931351 RepID=UPI00203D21DB|nr:GAF domain-containing protein [Kangiella sp. TOML190]